MSTQDLDWSDPSSLQSQWQVDDIDAAGGPGGDLMNLQGEIGNGALSTLLDEGDDTVDNLMTAEPDELLSSGAGPLASEMPSDGSELMSGGGSEPLMSGGGPLASEAPSEMPSEGPSDGSELMSGGDAEPLMSGGGPPASEAPTDESAPMSTEAPAPESGDAGGGPAPDGAAPTPGPDEGAAPEGPAGSGPADDLITQELAEHESWGTASAIVGEAGSADRAQFLGDQLGSGMTSGGAEGFGWGLAIGVGTALGTKALAPRLAAAAGPVGIALGAVVGGAFAIHGLATKDWAATGATLGAMFRGEGTSEYEQLANIFAGISEILDIAGNVLDVIAGVCGAVALAAWGLTALSLGAFSPVALTFSSIAAAIGIASMIIGALKSTVVQGLITLFRSLHAFKSEADPRDVQAQGAQLNAAGKAMGGFAGGLAASGVMKAGEAVGDRLRSPERPPPAGGGGGEPGPEPRVERSATPVGDDGVPLPDGNPMRDASDADISAALGGLDALAAGETPAPGSVRTGDMQHIETSRSGAMPPEPSVIVDPFIEGVTTTPAPPPPPGPTRPPTDVDWYDPVHNPTGTVHLDDVRAMGANPDSFNYDPGPNAGSHVLPEGGYRGELGMDKTTTVTAADGTPVTTREFSPEGYFSSIPDGSSGVRTGGPGGWVEHTYGPGEHGQAAAGAASSAARGREGIRDPSALPNHWLGADGTAVPGSPVDAMHAYEISNPRNRDPNSPHQSFETPQISSVAAPQPEPLPGGPSHRPGGGPQTQVPGWYAPDPSRPRENSVPFMSQPPFATHPVAPGTPTAAQQAGISLVEGARPIGESRPGQALQGVGDWWTDPNAGTGRRVLTGAGDIAAGGNTGASARDSRENMSRIFGGGGPGSPGQDPYAAGDSTAARASSDRGGFDEFLRSDAAAADSVVERVNPPYDAPPSPPGDLAGIEDITARITYLEDVRQTAATSEAAAGERLLQGAVDATAIASFIEGAGTTADGLQDHERDVADKQSAISEKSRADADAVTQAHDGADRFAGMNTLKGLLHTAKGFASMGMMSADWMPDRIQNFMAGMRDDSESFLEAIATAEQGVAAEAEAGPAREAQNEAAEALTEGVAAEAEETEAEVIETRSQAEQVATLNEEDVALTCESEEAATDARTTAEERIAELEALRDEQYQALASWAEAHRQARVDAVQEMADRIRDAGYEVLSVEGDQ